jgi:hypothetical protein
VYADKEVLKKTTIHRMVTKFWDTGNICDRKHIQHLIVLAGEMLCNAGGGGTKRTICLTKFVSPNLANAIGCEPCKNVDNCPTFAKMLDNSQHLTWLILKS